MCRKINQLFLLVFAYLISFFVLCNTAIASVDPWVDEVISFDQPEGSSNEGDPAIAAIGEKDSKFVSIDIPEILIVAFTNNTAFNGEGNDLEIYEWTNNDSNIDIYASCDNINYIYLGKTNKNTQYDFDDYSLQHVNYIKFIGLDDGGGYAGFDLDAVKALNSMEHIELSLCNSSNPEIVKKLNSTFDNDDEGWRFMNDVNLSWKSSGGSPGGFLQGNDLGDGRTWFFVSPHSWAGDWSLCNRFLYDLKLIDTGGTDSIANGSMVKIIGANGKEMNYTEPSDSPTSMWTTYSIDIKPGYFDVSEDIFTSILQNVKEVWIRGEYTSKHDIEGLDNVILESQKDLCEPTDTDFDGIIDQWDICKQTAINSATYSNGCRAYDLYSEIDLLKQQLEEQNQIIEQKNQIIVGLNSEKYEQNQMIIELNSIIDSMYSREKMEEMVQKILTWGDINDDGKIGLNEAIKALMITSGIDDSLNKKKY